MNNQKKAVVEDFLDNVLVLAVECGADSAEISYTLQAHDPAAEESAVNG